ncbi:flagellar hook-length control protein FliK [Shinella sp. BYT-45]|uniref:flagellar hook-length control protein FliK n=1 Tax=Shinella sp. BYT-45 TaxID=3377377 RepID=UPI003980FA21
MSTIGSGILGVLQGQAPSKGKAGQGKTADPSAKGDFAITIANLHAKDEEGGRKGGRISISGNGRGELDAGQAGGTQAKTIRRDMPADVLREAGGEVPEGEIPFDVASLADSVGRPDRKTHSEKRESAKAGAQKAGELAAKDDGDGAAPDKAATDRTDVGNLLELLAAPTTPHAVIDGSTAKAVVQDVRVQPGGKASAKADIQAAKAGASVEVPHLVDAGDAGDVPQSDTDQLFRLIRADGKGRELDMSITGAGDRATFRDASPTGPQGETVTVVDARRYIGLAQTGNAAAVTTAITQDPEWTASLSATGSLTHSEAAATGKVVNTLKIQMHPIELGLVTATLRLHGDDLVVSLQVETGEAYRQLTDDQDAIVRALRGQGFAVDQVSVQLAPADRGASAQGDGQGQQSQQQQFSSQPQAREGGNGRERGGEQGTGTFGREERTHEGTMSETASGLAGGQSVRSGGVYI